MFQYEEISRDIEYLVLNGTLQAGDKIPSVRKISSQYGVSVSTVLSAYIDLEKKGFIQGKERSGYFARLPASRKSDPPESPREIRISRDITPARLIRQFCEASRRVTPPQFGAALPDPALMPLSIMRRKVAQAARQHSSSIDEYDFSQGPLELRREIAKLYFRRGLNVSPEDIIITNGCLEAIMLTLKSVAPPGCTVLVETPTYFCFLELLRFHGYDVCEVPASTETGIDLACLEETLDSCNIGAAILMPCFQNPTGACMPDTSKKNLADMFARRQIPVIEDDIYGELAFDETNPSPLKAFDKQDLVITCSSFSKTLSTGLRVGWLINGRFREKILDSKAIQFISSPLINAYAAANYLVDENYERHIFRLKRAFEYQLVTLSEKILASFPDGTKISNPAGGFILWVQLPDYVDSTELFRGLIEKGINIAPGSMFCSQGSFRNFMRMNCGFGDSHESDQALATIAEMIRVKG